MVVVVRNDMEWLWTFILYVDRISNRSIIVDGDCICVGFYCRAWSVLFLWPYKWIIGLCRDLLDISLIDDLSLHLPHPSGTNKVGTSKGGLHRRRRSRSTCLARDLWRCLALAWWVWLVTTFLSPTLFASHSLRTEAEAEAEDMDFISAFSFSLSPTSTATRGWMA